MNKLHFSLASAALGAFTLALGCSEANDDTDGGFMGPIPGADAANEAAPGHEAGGGTDGGTHAEGGSTVDQSAGETSPPVDAGNPGLVINEVNGKGQDFVELFNGGTETADIAGWGVTEAKHEDSGTLGKEKSPALFAGGAKLEAGQYAVIWGAPQEGGTAPSCTATLCLQATWNVSNKSGATVYLLDPAGKTVSSEAYPADTVGTGQSWGRLPNGTGSFAVNTATPGKANEAP
jgi:hypothetical protein